MQLYKARAGQVVAQTGPEQEILSLPSIYFFDGWQLHPKLPIPDHLPRVKEAPVQSTALTAPAPGTDSAAKDFSVWRQACFIMARKQDQKTSRNMAAMKGPRLSAFEAFSAQAMVDGRDHKNCDKLHSNDLQILRLDFRRDTSYLTMA